MEKGAGLMERLERYSVRLGATSAPATLVVSSRGDLPRLFERARRELAGGPIRIVGHGVTVRAVWPRWLAENDVVLTELGAYRVRPGIDASKDMRSAVRRWLDGAFAGAVGSSVAPVFFPTASARLFQEAFDLAAMAEGITASGARRIVCLDEAEPLTPFFERSRPTSLRRISHALRVASAGAAGIVASALQQLRAAHAAVETRVELRRRRAEPAKGKLWVALVPDLERINRHVIESVAMPALARGELAGVLLLGTLASGERSERDLKTRTGDELWSGLGPLRSGKLRVDQIVGEESVGQAVRSMSGDALAAARIVARLAVGPLAVPDAPSLPLVGRSRALASLATVDVFRARAGARAANRVAHRQDLDRSTIVFVGCAMPGAAAAVAELRRAHAHTVDFVHGAGWDNAYGAAETPADLVVAWTEPDAKIYRELGLRAVQAGMPRPPATTIKALGSSASRRVLILSNYCHRDTGPRGHPLKAFQYELLRIPELAKARGMAWTFTWRPHPSDDMGEVNKTLASVRDVTLRPEGTLREALAVHDVVVTSLSTSVYEALFTGLPVFVHVAPEWDGAPAYAFLPRERCFFRAEDGVERMVSAKPGNDPERRALLDLFGGAPEPHVLDASILSAPVRP